MILVIICSTPNFFGVRTWRIEACHLLISTVQSTHIRTTCVHSNVEYHVTMATKLMVFIIHDIVLLQASSIWCILFHLYVCHLWEHLPVCTLNLALIESLVFIGETVDLVLWSIFTGEGQPVEVPRVAELSAIAHGRASQGQGITSFHLLRLWVFDYPRPVVLGGGHLLLIQQNCNRGTSCMWTREIVWYKIKLV